MTGVGFFLGTNGLASPQAHEVLDAFFAAGGRHLDTARVYGENEGVVGDWLSSRDVRDEMIVVTKGGHPELPSWSTRISEREVLSDAHRSLAELGLDRVDVYLLHRDDIAVPVDEIAAILSRLVDDGLAARVGVSNWGADRFAALCSELESSGGPPIAFISNYYGLAVVKGHLLPGVHATAAGHFKTADRYGARVLAWMPTAQGYFVKEDWSGEEVFDSPDSRRRRGVLKLVADRHGVEPDALLTRWLTASNPIVVPVFGTSRPERIRSLVEHASAIGLDEASADLDRELGSDRYTCGEFEGTLDTVINP